MHYCYLLTHDTHGAAAFRMAQLGDELIKRGHRVSYIANDADEPERRGKPGEKIPTGATVELIRAGRSSRPSSRAQGAEAAEAGLRRGAESAPADAAAARRTPRAARRRVVGRAAVGL